ncbi:MAG: hypothetical protein NC253_03675 [Ruminococcus sp.]|nr:hypothetical protein [Ruminococcus sp.]MCM1381627.1 hypothetical protein [Muribaculaceae bacterium]MCM1479254.1 hypothetical protein [Muribaculaceae bacterium]
MAKEKKKSGGKILLVVVLLVIIVLVIIYFFGNGFGFGKGGGDAVPADVTVSETTEETTALQETLFAEVTVDGEEYLYNNQSRALDELITEITKTEGEIEVHILLSDTATLAAREALETRLDEENIPHSIVEYAE